MTQHKGEIGSRRRITNLNCNDQGSKKRHRRHEGECRHFLRKASEDYFNSEFADENIKETQNKDFFFLNAIKLFKNSKQQIQVFKEFKAYVT